MAKLTKKQVQQHENALRLLAQGNLSADDVLEVFESYREGANHINSKAGAFFTPYGLANDLILHLSFTYEEHHRIIDLCAGIGVLGYVAARSCNSHNRCTADITCVEINPDYVEVGKKLLPEATWICGDALDPALLGRLGHFDYAISNPPFGKIVTAHRGVYTSSVFEHMLIEAAAGIADEGFFIIPQTSAPFIYSGTDNSRWLEYGRGREFEKRTGIKLEFNIGVDTSFYKKEWHGTAPTCEIVCCDFTKRLGQM